MSSLAVIHRSFLRRLFPVRAVIWTCRKTQRVYANTHLQFYTVQMPNGLLAWRGSMHKTSSVTILTPSTFTRKLHGTFKLSLKLAWATELLFSQVQLAYCRVPPAAVIFSWRQPWLQCRDKSSSNATALSPSIRYVWTYHNASGKAELWNQMWDVYKRGKGGGGSFPLPYLSLLLLLRTDVFSFQCQSKSCTNLELQYSMPRTRVQHLYIYNNRKVKWIISSFQSVRMEYRLQLYSSTTQEN